MSFEIRLANRYKLDKEIGSGGFGVVYEGTNIENKKKVAIKIEERDVKKQPKLEKEFELYDKLKGEEGFIEVESYVVGDFYNMLVMDLLGASLGCLFNFVGKKFSLKTTLMIADQLLTRLEYIHSKGIVYRDVKPNNFVMGVGNKENTIYVVDFGLAKMFIDENKKHLPFEQQNFAGTAHYASLNAHLKRAQSRRDDLESLGYLLIYFLEGQLPWHGVKASSKRDRRKMIGICKLKTPIRELCKGLNTEFVTFFEYVRSLEYADKPDYAYLRKLFRHLFENKGYEYDGKFDWTLKKESYYPSYISPKLVIIPTKKKKARQSERNKQVQTMRQLKTEREKEFISVDQSSDSSDHNKKKPKKIKKKKDKSIYDSSN